MALWIGAIVVISIVLIELVLRPLIFGQGESKKSLDETTIQPELQHVVDSVLKDRLEEWNDLQGQVIVMEVQTGEILAMVGRERRFDGRYRPCDNFAYQQEPGSTMKVVSLLALLETGEVHLTDVVDVGNGLWEEGDFLMKDHNWHRGGYGKMTLDRALEVSSNIAISKTIQKVFKGKEQQYFELLDKMSFGQPDSIEGISELQPMVFSSPQDSAWASRQLLWNSIGYERLMAPIQTLTFYNAIANNGRMVKPTLVKGKTEVINERIASRSNIAKMQQALYHVVTQGLGKRAGTPLVSVAGKSGTAQVESFHIFTDDEIENYHLSFCGYFPAESPKYSMIVSINKLGLPASGGAMAGPVFREIAEWMVRHDMLQVEEDEYGSY